MGRKNGKHKNANSKHDSICNQVKSIIDSKSNYNKISTNIEYELGECDVLCRNSTREVYYEVKNHYNDKAYCRATEQLNRWTSYMDRKGNKNYYGVLYTPEKIVMLSKNGFSRHIEF